MAENYEEILNRGWDEVPEVKVLPEGSWLLAGRNAAYKEPEGDSNPFLMFVYEPKEPMDDVDTDALDELGADYDFSNNRLFFRMWLETSADWDKVRKHLVKHGIDVSGSIKDSLDAFKGTEIVSYLEQRSYTDNAGEPQVTNDPTQFAKAD